MPYAVFGTIILSTGLYILASLALVGMQSYHNIDTDSGFSEAFMAQGTSTWNAIGQIVAVGELLALPLVVLISFMAQPRLLYAMAQDNLAPALFARANAAGNLTESLLVSGAAFTILAAFIPFKYLENMVSAGILINFNLTNVAYILMRLRECRDKQHASGASRYLPPGGQAEDSSSSNPARSYFGFTVCPGEELPWLLACFNGMCIATSVCIVNSMFASSRGRAIPWACFGAFFLMMLYLCAHSIARLFQENGDGSLVTGAENPLRQDSSSTADTEEGEKGEDAPFTLRAPWFPAIPLVGMLINWFLLAQLPLSGFAFLLGYFGLTLLSYATTFCCLGQSAGLHTAESSVNGLSQASSKLLWASLAQSEDASSSSHSILHSEHIDVGIYDSDDDDEEVK